VGQAWNLAAPLATRIVLQFKSSRWLDCDRAVGADNTALAGNSDILGPAEKGMQEAAPVFVGNCQLFYFAS
jgi:hypothetical protein